MFSPIAFWGVSVAAPVCAGNLLSNMNNLQIYYKMDGNAIDSSGLSNNGTGTNVSYTSGKFGDAVVLNGTNAYITNTSYSPGTVNTNFTGSYSIAFWVKEASQPEAEPNTHVYALKMSNDVFGWMIDAFPNGANMDYRFFIRTSSPSALAQATYTVAPLPLNTWRHMAATYDGSNARLYIDGVNVATASHTSGFKISSNALAIGYWNPTGGPKNYVDGQIDDFQIWHRALSTAEIEQLAAGTCPLRTTTFTGGRYVAVSYDGTNRVMYSDNATSWTSASVTANPWLKAVWSPELRRICVVGNNCVMTSSNGISWNDRTPAASNAWRGLCWSSTLSLFVAVSTSGSGNRVMTSPDGITWTSRTSANDVEWFAVTWSPELSLFAAVSNTGTTAQSIMTSPDGTTWAAATASSAGNWRDICWSKEQGIFVAVGVNQIMTSSDGVTWTSRTSPQNNNWFKVKWNPEQSIFVSISQAGTNRVMTSPDGITWTLRNAAAANEWLGLDYSVEYNNWVAVSQTGTGNRVMTSPDGITWTSRTSAANNSWHGVVYCPGLGFDF